MKLDRKWWVLLAVGTGSFMAALDGSVVNTILPVIRDELNAGIAAVEWVVTTYLLVISGLLLTFGRLGDLFGHKNIYLWGFGIFVTSSALCGFAESVNTLIIFRGLQAIGGAMLASNSPAILTGNFPARHRGRAIGLNSMMTYLGLTAGPSLGGWLAHSVGWRSVFYINIPVGMLALTLSLIFIPREQRSETRTKFDVPGAALFLVGLILFMLALNKGAEWGWVSIPTLSLLLLSILLLVTFVIVESRSPAPMLNLELFRAPLFSASTLSALLNYICIFCMMFLLPFYLIQGRGLDPAQAGLILSAQPIIMALTAPVSGALSDRLGARLPTSLGMAILAGGLFLLSRLTHSTPLWMVTLGLAVAGLGTGIFISPNTSALLGAAPANRQGIASGVLAAGRNVGMVLGIGLAGAIFTTHLAADPGFFYEGISNGLLAAAIIAVAAIVVSAIKER